MRPTLLAAVALTAGLLACSPVSSRLSDTRHEPGPEYFFADATKRKGRKIERLSDPSLLTARYGYAKRRTMYVIQDAGVAGIPRFDFHPVDKATLEVKLKRISDVGGGGIEKGVARREATVRREYPKAEVYQAFVLLQGLASDPIATLKAEAPQEWETVGQAVQIDPQEAGFAIAIEAELRSGNPLDPSDHVTLYRLEARSPYQRAEDAPAETAPATEPAQPEPAPDPNAPKPTSSPS